MMKLLLILALAITAGAQTFPRWPNGQQVKVYTLDGAFTDKEQTRINAAIESWRPMLPSGITFTFSGETAETQLCQGCITLDRQPTPRDKWGMTYAHFIGKEAVYTQISIDKRAGSGDAFQHSVEHEIGHALGLDHRPNSVMSAGQVKQRPSEADAAILRVIYAPDTATGLIATTGALPRFVVPAVNMTVTARAESDNLTALQRYSFRRDVLIQTLNVANEVTGTYTRVSRMVLADDGSRIEKVLSRESHLKGLRITKQDEADFSGAQMGLLDDFGRYGFHQTPNGTIQVDPVSTDGKRSFKGEIKISDKGIVWFHGTTMPEGSERFPVVTVTRTEVDGHLFPSEAFGEGVLQFPKSAVRVRWKVTVSDYKRFASKVSITEIE